MGEVLMDLPPGFELDDVMSRQQGVPVAVNRATGERIRQKPGKGEANPMKVYAETRARERAKDDEALLDSARAMEQEAYSSEATANRADGLIERAPTGPMADFRIDMGRALGGTPLSLLPGIPNSEQTVDLEMVRNIGSQGALGDVSKLKGPLSEKELAFIQRLQIDPNATRPANRKVVEAQKWAARRQAAYGRSLRAWEARLGSPTAANAQGLTFDGWWGKYAAEKLPSPETGGAMSSPQPGAAKTPSAPSDKQAMRQEAAAAIRAGAPRDKVIARLRAMGLTDTSGL